MTLPSVSTLADLLTALAITPDGEATLLVVNGRTAEPEQALKDGDEVHLIPAISGGSPGREGRRPQHGGL